MFRGGTVPLSGGATPPETRWNGERLQGTLSRFVSRSACFGGTESVSVPVGNELERVKGIERFNFTLKISNLKLDARFPDTFLTNLSPFAKSKRDPMKRKSC